MKYKNSYVSKSSTLAPFEEVLVQWLKLNDRYHNAENDLISCYTELSCVSHLSAAAWSCPSGDWVCLQEYQVAKRQNSQRRKKVLGRADLFLKYKKKKYVAEVKRVYINVKTLKPEKLLKKLDDRVWGAWYDIEKNIDQEDAENLIALTFFDFQFPCKGEEENYFNRIPEYIQKIESEYFDAGAYWFLKEPIVQDGCAYCGTYLTIEEYKK